jgi:hypothetical protein
MLAFGCGTLEGLWVPPSSSLPVLGSHRGTLLTAHLAPRRWGAPSHYPLDDSPLAASEASLSPQRNLENCCLATQ